MNKQYLKNERRFEIKMYVYFRIIVVLLLFPGCAGIYFDYIKEPGYLNQETILQLEGNYKDDREYSCCVRDDGSVYNFIFGDSHRVLFPQCEKE